MLKRRSLISTLYLGVRKNDADALAAHARLRTASGNSVGDDNQPGFRVVAMFGTRL